MKTKYLLAAGAALLVFILAGCTIEYDTKIQPDQSGRVSTAIGFTADELKYLTSQSNNDASKICDEMWKDSSSSLPPNAVTRQEQKGDETWCYVDVDFANLEELRSYYTDQKVKVNRLEVVKDTFYYDVTFDMSSDTSMVDFPLLITWKVSMPGTVRQHNADLGSGRSLTWNLASASGAVNMKAESSLSSSNWAWWAAGGLVCLCLVVIVIGAGVGLLLYLRKKKPAPAG